MIGQAANTLARTSNAFAGAATSTSLSARGHTPRGWPPPLGGPKARPAAHKRVQHRKMNNRGSKIMALATAGGPGSRLSRPSIAAKSGRKAPRKASENRQKAPENVGKAGVFWEFLGLFRRYTSAFDVVACSTRRSADE